MAKNEKTFNEQNMRKIIRILSGLSASQQQLAEQCVNEYQADKTYSKDNICFYNGTLYRAKTVTLGNTPSPESTYFEMLDGVEEEIDAQYIETLMSTVSAETFDYMKNFINDDIISGTHGYSSAKIYSEIQSAIQTAKDYTLTQVANSSTGSYVIANGTDEVVDDKHLFLISNGSSYDIYALVNGAPTKIGDTSVSLNGLLTEATAETTYLKQADATATYATITTTDGLRTDLDNHINNTVAHLTQEERDKLVTTDVLGDYAKTVDLPTPRTDDEIKTLANGQIESSKQVLQFSDLKGITADSTLDEVVRAVPGSKIAILQSAAFTNYLGLPHQMYTITINSLGYNRMQVFATSKYSDHASYVGACDNSSGVDVYDKWIKVITDKHVTITIDSSSTDTQVPSAKSVYDNAIKDKNLKTYTYLEQIGLRKPTTVGDIFNALPILSSINIQVDNFSITDAPYGNGILMIDKYINSKFSILFKISGAGSVADNGLYIGQLKGSDGTGLTWKRVCATTVEDTSGTATVSNGATGTVTYKVMNGVCYVGIKGLANGLNGTQVCNITGLPTSSVYVNAPIECDGARVGTVYYDSSKNAFIVHKSSTTGGHGSFSYPVAES